MKFTRVIDSTWLRDLLSWVLPMQFFFRRPAEKQGLGGMMAVGKSKAKVYVVKISRRRSMTVPGWKKQKKSCKKSWRS